MERKDGRVPEALRDTLHQGDFSSSCFSWPQLFFDLNLVTLGNEHLEVVLDSCESLTLTEPLCNFWVSPWLIGELLPESEFLPDWWTSGVAPHPLVSLGCYVLSEPYFGDFHLVTGLSFVFLTTSVLFSRPFVWQSLKLFEFLLCVRADLGFHWVIWNRIRLMRRSLLWLM